MKTIIITGGSRGTGRSIALAVAKNAIRISKISKLLMMTVILTGGIMAHAQAQENALKSTPADLVDALHTTFGEHHARQCTPKGFFLKELLPPQKRLQKSQRQSIYRKKTAG